MFGGRIFRRCALFRTNHALTCVLGQRSSTRRYPPPAAPGASGGERASRLGTGPVPLDDVPEFVSGDVDESDVGAGVDIDGAWLAIDIDAVEDIELGCGWRNCSNVSPEGSLKRLPDSRKSVRQFNGCIRILPIRLQRSSFQNSSGPPSSSPSWCLAGCTSDGSGPLGSTALRLRAAW